MGSQKIKKRRLMTDEQMVKREALDLEDECKVIFKDDYEEAMVKLIKLDDMMEEDRAMRLYVSLNLTDLYEILLDNTEDEIIAYFKEKMDEE